LDKPELTKQSFPQVALSRSVRTPDYPFLGIATSRPIVLISPPGRSGAPVSSASRTTNRGFMYKKISSAPQKTDGVSVLGLYGEFQNLRAGAHNLRHLGFGVRDVSFLFLEAALSTQNSHANFQVDVTKPGSIGALIGGTLDSLGYLGGQGEGIIAGAMMSLGIPKYEAEEYESGILQRKLLLCARSFSLVFGDLAMEALLHTGAELIIAVPQPTVRPNIMSDNNLTWYDAKPLFEASLIC
jgi:hypothetical protein